MGNVYGCFIYSLTHCNHSYWLRVSWLIIYYNLLLIRWFTADSYVLRHVFFCCDAASFDNISQPAWWRSQLSAQSLVKGYLTPAGILITSEFVSKKSYILYCISYIICIYIYYHIFYHISYHRLYNKSYHITYHIYIYVCILYIEYCLYHSINCMCYLQQYKFVIYTYVP